MFKLITGRKWLQKSVCAKKQKREDDTEEDKIGGLPDEVLLSVLSLLPIKEAARTSVLARRWRKVWTFMPILNFDASQALLSLKVPNITLGPLKKKVLAVERDKYVEWVNLVLEAYKGYSIDEFRVRFDLDENHKCDIDKWVNFAIEKKVKRLTMDFKKYLFAHYNEKVYCLPPLCDTFKRLHYCRSLIALQLKCVNISGGVVEYLIASCPYLRQLSVEGSHSIVDLKVSGESLCLEDLKIGKCRNLKSIYISAKNLSSFEYTGNEIELSFANVPNLVEVSLIVGYAQSNIHYFPQLSSLAFQLVTLKLWVSHLEGKLARLKIPLLGNLKNFELKAYGNVDMSLLSFAPLIEAAPSLRRFALEFHWNMYPSGRTRKLKKIPKCTHHCLKEVELVGFVGQAIDMEFTMYLIENAIALEKIVIDPLVPSWTYLGWPWTPKDIRTTKKQAMKLKSKFSLGDKLILRNF